MVFNDTAYGAFDRFWHSERFLTLNELINIYGINGL